MAKPTILAVDDDPAVLSAITRDLQRYYGSNYRILRANGGATALTALDELRRRNEPVVLFLVDQRMPNMNGIEFLTEAIQRYPTAKRALLTAYADTEAAIAAINRVAADYYLLKPWDPPKPNFIPFSMICSTIGRPAIDRPLRGCALSATAGRRGRMS